MPTISCQPKGERERVRVSAGNRYEYAGIGCGNSGIGMQVSLCFFFHFSVGGGGRHGEQKIRALVCGNLILFPMLIRWRKNQKVGQGGI